MATERRPKPGPRKRAASNTTSRSRTTKTSVTARRAPARGTKKAAASAAPRGIRKPKGTKATKLPAEVAQALAAAQDKKAENINVLDLRKGQGAFTDFFIIATGNNMRQVQAIADGVEETLKKSGVRPALVEGYSRAEWILLDYFDFIVHVFTPKTREFYALERLWGDAEAVEVSA